VSWTTDQVLRRLFRERSVSEWTDATGTLSLIERALPDKWAGRKLADLDEADKFRLVSLTRGGATRLAVPGLVGQEGDVLQLAVRTDAVEELEGRLDAAPEGH
jgi:trk system potassium uptake protein TrkA